MKALISPQELVYNNGQVIGYRVADISATGFDVAEPLFWVDCDTNVVVDQFYYSDGNIIEKPAPTVIEKPAPTLGELQAQLAALTAQMAALANTG